AAPPAEYARYLLAQCGWDQERAHQEAGRYPWVRPDLGPQSQDPLALAPMFPDERGKLHSLRQLHGRLASGEVLRYLPESGEGRGLRLTQQDREALERLLGPDRLAVAAEETGKKKPSRPKDVGWQVRTEGELLNVLKTWLTRVQDRGLTPGVGLPRWNLQMSAAPGAGPADCCYDGVYLNRRHPLVKRAIEEFREDPEVFWLLASAVLTAANRWSPFITLADELRLQRSLAELMLSGIGHTPDSAGEIHGLLDPILSDGVLTGWASDPCQPEAALRVYVYLEDRSVRTLLGTCLADQPCPEVNEGTGELGPHGFRFPIPARYHDGRKRTVVAQVDLNGHRVELPGSPRTFLSRQPHPASPMGHLDRVDPSGKAVGWALDPNTPEAVVAIHFYLDGPAGEGEFIGGVGADQPRGDVNQHTGYHGHHGFIFQVPAEHLDGSQHRLYAYGIDTDGGHNPLLSGCPMTFTG
ncbi:MAG: hypothetical protein AB1758_20675, partial [Candidatus Eremiobacterota bacterium]